MTKRHIAVIGAGAFGGWTALHMLRKGARVTLLDAWGPGHSRASSGDHSRIIRHTHQSRIYVDMAARSLALWRAHDMHCNEPLYHRTGVLWMVERNDGLEQAGLAHLGAANIAHRVLTAEEIARRFPEINVERVLWGLYEEDAGYLLARRGCEVVVEAFVMEGGEYRMGWASPGRIRSERLEQVCIDDGSALTADHYVFACGPWLGKIFPELLGGLIQATRQEVFYFGTPSGAKESEHRALPVWANRGERFWYGIPVNGHHGFKVADDSHGPSFDPTHGERTASAEKLEEARAYMEFRFPGMRGAPLLESRVCQYENTPDGGFMLDQHPEAMNVWIMGGGSGHGYKHGPALGERMTERVLEGTALDPAFSLRRFRQQ